MRMTGTPRAGGGHGAETLDGALPSFEHESLTQRVVFASGRAAERVRAEVRRLGASRVMVIAAPAEAELAWEVTADLPVVLRWDEVVMHVPVDVAERARAAAAAHRVDLLVSVGGGSTTGLAKAIALTSGLPILAVPTTYAGSEATSVWGLTERAHKTTGVDARVLPRSVVYDATLTVSLPVRMSVASGLNALAHCVDAMWGPRADPIDRALAGEGIRALAAGLPAVVADPVGLPGREQALYGTYLSAVAFSSAGSGLHHKICHVLGGRYDLPHAQTHAVVLPYVLAFNAPAAPESEQRIAAAFGSDSAIEGLQRLRRDVDAPKALRDFGWAEAEVDDAVEAVLDAVPDGNPRPVRAEDVRRLLRAAWQGADPRTVTDDSTARTHDNSVAGTHDDSMARRDDEK
ncbi:maleylacetate reductase [Streptomyces caniscabiei]|uniref:maleylacetate reductase n=1 Tax=Streptomyces caniscabiei TaxID=2746961 RepID=UPI0029B03BF2|nr:maleylacetate reductase [Streptomyces caniscabiei]MDX2604963.1 maleylacetate reductase [Streptomyces caniscabiei]MDX2733871.1 maleylacetate reductase [Streptomyces caniscabiei]MDX2777319.1 maleylacetate reductase [Streptomyces caniscabiei]